MSDQVQRHQRVDHETKINLEFEKFSAFLQDYSRNISEGGVFIKTTKPQPVGSRCSFEFKLKDDFVLIHGWGEVRWTREQAQGNDKPAGMGVKFVDIDKAGAELIRKIVSQQKNPVVDPSQPPADAQVAAPKATPATPPVTPAAAAAGPPTEEIPATNGFASPPALGEEMTSPWSRDPQAQSPAESTAAPTAVDMTDLPLPELDMLAPQAAPPAAAEKPASPAANGPAGGGLLPDDFLQDAMAMSGNDNDILAQAAKPVVTPPPAVAKETVPDTLPVDPTDEILAQALSEAGAETPPVAASASGPAVEPEALKHLAAEAQAEPATPQIGGLIDGSLDSEPAAENPVFEPTPSGEVELPFPDEKPVGAGIKKRTAAWKKMVSAVILLALVGFGYWKKEHIIKAGQDLHYLTLKWRKKTVPTVREQKTVIAGKTITPLPQKPPVDQGGLLSQALVIEEGEIAPPPAAPAVNSGAAPLAKKSAPPAKAPAPVATKAQPPPPAPKVQRVAQATKAATQVTKISSASAAGTTIVSFEGNGALKRERIEIITVQDPPPRLVIKIKSLNDGYQPATIDVKGSPHLRRIRSGFHADKSLHVVFDLKGKIIPPHSVSQEGGALLVKLGQ